MSESLVFTLKLAVFGMGIVFIALVVISSAIALFKKVDERWEQRESHQAKAAFDKSPTIDNTTLVLIAAAAATMIKGRFYIRSVRKILPRDAVRSPWSVQGRATLHGSHVPPRKGGR